jgi:hypothetical protein
MLRFDMVDISWFPRLSDACGLGLQLVTAVKEKRAVSALLMLSVFSLDSALKSCAVDTRSVTVNASVRSHCCCTLGLCVGRQLDSKAPGVVMKGKVAASGQD